MKLKNLQLTYQSLVQIAGRVGDDYEISHISLPFCAVLRAFLKYSRYVF